MFAVLLSCIVCVSAVDFVELLDEDEAEPVAVLDEEAADELLVVELPDDDVAVAVDESGVAGLVESSAGRTSSLGIAGLSVIPLMLEYIETWS